jgi:hypothetical protein
VRWCGEGEGFQLPSWVNKKSGSVSRIAEARNVGYDWARKSGETDGLTFATAVSMILSKYAMSFNSVLSCYISQCYRLILQCCIPKYVKIRSS